MSRNWDERDEHILVILRRNLTHIMNTLWMNCIGKHYFEIVDKLIAEIERRFQLQTFILYSKVDEVFRKATFGENTSTDLQEIIDHLGKIFRNLNYVLNFHVQKRHGRHQQFLYFLCKRKVIASPDTFLKFQSYLGYF